MDEIRQREDVILNFIDEIHEIVGAGSASEGNMDAGSILKPALAHLENSISRGYYPQWIPYHWKRCGSGTSDAAR